MTANENISRVFRAEDAISCQTADKRFRDSRLHTGGPEVAYTGGADSGNAFSQPDCAGVAVCRQSRQFRLNDGIYQGSSAGDNTDGVVFCYGVYVFSQTGAAVGGAMCEFYGVAGVGGGASMAAA